MQNVGSCLRSLVTFAHKSRWLGRDVDPMWHVAYSSRSEHQGESHGFIPRDTLPNDEQCAAIFESFVGLGEPVWSLAMRLASRLRCPLGRAHRPASV